MTPLQRANVGTYTFKLKACVSLGPNPALGFEVCELSDEFDIVIFDPCETTQFVSSIWSYVMTARIADTDQIQIDQQLLTENKRFPWTTQVDLNAPSTLNFLLCGPVEYSIAPNDYVDNATPLVTLGGQNGLSLVL